MRTMTKPGCFSVVYVVNWIDSRKQSGPAGKPFDVGGDGRRQLFVERFHQAGQHGLGVPPFERRCQSGVDVQQTAVRDYGESFAALDRSHRHLRRKREFRPIATLDEPTSLKPKHFGRAVAVSGDVVFVGAPADDTLLIDAGAVHAFDLASATPTRRCAAASWRTP